MKIIHFFGTILYRLKVLVVLSCGIFLLSGSAAIGQKQSGSSKEVDVHKWIKKHFSKNEVPPFSFVYDGKNSETFIKEWKYNSTEEESNDPNVEKHLFTYTDKLTGLEVKCHVTGYKTFHTVEWVLNLKNNSSANTPLIEKASVVDKEFTYGKKGDFILHHSNGTTAQRTDFMPFDDTLITGKTISLIPGDHGSSCGNAFPFFNIESPDESGIVVAIGWTGKWFADVEQKSGKSVSLKSGMFRTHLVLYPGEEIRTPSVALLFWQGEDRMIGHNKFRQFVLAYHSRKINNHFAELPLSFGFEYGDPAPCNEYNCLTDTYAIAVVKRTKQFNIVPDVFWLDAGWYTGCGDWGSHVGNWTVEKERFPNGLKPIADAIHSIGAKFMVWFEAERVYEGTMIEQEHPEFLIKLPDNKSAAFNLGDDKARIWLTDYISAFLKEQGIDYYRQDHNFDPQPYWQANEKPDRIGMTEIKNIEGLYAYWDSLLVRFPNLIIDNCASGGNRLDLETIGRSSPLWRTDYQYGEPNGYQCHTYGLNFYLPLHGTGEFYNTTPYYMRSSFSSGMAINWHMNHTISIPVMQKAVQDYRRLKPYYYGDYYPLTGNKNITEDNVWLSYEMNRPDKGDGILVAFRRNACIEESITVKLKGLDPKANYELLDEDTGIKTIKTGNDLMKGITLTQKEKPGSTLIDFRKIN